MVKTRWDYARKKDCFIGKEEVDEKNNSALFYHDEIASMQKPVPKMKLDENEISMAKMLIENMTRPFHAEEFRDEYQARLRDAIMQKIQGQEIVAVDTGGSANVIDLMEALQKSLDLSNDPDEESRKKLTGTA